MIIDELIEDFKNRKISINNYSRIGTWHPPRDSRVCKKCGNAFMPPKKNSVHCSTECSESPYTRKRGK